MVNLSKSTIGGTSGRVLGHRWESGGYFRPEGKGLKALLDLPHSDMARVPTASIYGLLSFFRPYIHDFAVRTEPLRKLLSATHGPWEEKHTELVKDVV